MKELDIFQRNVRTTNEPELDRLVRSEVLSPAPTGSGTLARVQAVGEPGGQHLLGEATWPRPPGSAVPVAGQQCLVAIDEDGQPWIIAWDRSGW